MISTLSNRESHWRLLMASDAAVDLEDAMWRRIKYHGVSLALLENAGKLADWPAQLVQKIRHEGIMQTLWEESHRQALQSLFDAFSKLGVEGVLMKGSAGIPADIWAPASVDRARTLVAFLGLIAPLAIIVIGGTLDDRDRRALGWTLVIIALVSFAIGVMQILSANSFGLFYPIQAKPSVLYATFANRNSTGMLFVAAVIMVIALPSRVTIGSLAFPAVAGFLLLLGAILTQSRSSMALLAIAILFLLCRTGWSVYARRRSPRTASGRGGVIVVALALLALAAIAGSAMLGGRTAASFERFADMETDRPEMWEDGLYAASQYWPVGSGMGTFDEVFQVHESLEYVSPRKAGRAHNDFIEIAIEAGAAGLALLFLWAAWCLAALLRQFRGSAAWVPLGAGLVLGCIALQSLLDYPLRNQTLLCVAALMIVLLTTPRKEAA